MSQRGGGSCHMTVPPYIMLRLIVHLSSKNRDLNIVTYNIFKSRGCNFEDGCIICNNVAKVNSR